jgi:hypothetical protein
LPGEVRGKAGPLSGVGSGTLVRSG